MLLEIRSLFSPKVRVNIRFSGILTDQSLAYEGQRLISQMGLLGWMRVITHEGIEIEVEGPRAKLEKLIADLRVRATRNRLNRMDIGWKTFSGKLEAFRVRNN